MSSNSLISRALTVLKRSGWRGYAIIFMMTVTFLLLGILLTIVFTSQSLISYFKEQPEVIGFFANGVTEEQILEVKRDVEFQSFVSGVTYTSQEQALADFIEDNKDRPEITENVTISALPAHLNIKPVSLEAIPEAVSYFENNQLITDIRSSEDILDVLRRIVWGIQIFAAALLGIIAVSTFIIIFLSIGITIYSHKNELIVMKLVGASDWYVRSPYLVLSLIYAVIATLLSAVVLVPLLLTQYSNVVASFVGDLNLTLLTPEILAAGVGVELLFGVLLASISSLLATRRYIKY